MGHNSVKILWMTSKFELDLYFLMLYPSVNIERNCCIPSKVIDLKPQFSQNRRKKSHYSVKILQMTSLFELDLYSMMLYPFLNFEWNWCIPSKVIDLKPKLWRHRQSHDLHVSTMLHRPHNKNRSMKHVRLYLSYDIKITLKSRFFWSSKLNFVKYICNVMKINL